MKGIRLEGSHKKTLIGHKPWGLALNLQSSCEVLRSQCIELCLTGQGAGLDTTEFDKLIPFILHYF